MSNGRGRAFSKSKNILPGCPIPLTPLRQAQRSAFPKEGGNEAKKGARWARSAPAPLFSHNSSSRSIPEGCSPIRGGDRNGAQHNYFEKTIMEEALQMVSSPPSPKSVSIRTAARANITQIFYSPGSGWYICSCESVISSSTLKTHFSPVTLFSTSTFCTYQSGVGLNTVRLI